MIPGLDCFVKHPQVPEFMRYPTYASRNSFGQVVRSDGRVYRPMWPDEPAILVSPSGVLFRLGECKVVDKLDVPGDVTELQRPLEPSIDDYIRALNTGFHRDADEERYLRLRLWWRCNDRRRGREGTVSDYTEEERTSHQALYQLYEKVSVPDSVVMLAELARQLGDFERSRSLLARRDLGEVLNKVADRLYYEAARNSARLVAVLCESEDAATLKEGRRLRSLGLVASEDSQ